jgi:RNA polymerase sigma-70 factor (ECF subfamily)
VRFTTPEPEELGDRLPAVLAVVYLVFNEGYLTSGSAAPGAHRRELTREGLDLARQLTRLMPAEPEAAGLAALLELHEARAATRFDADGHIILLEDQDRSRWDRDTIAEGNAVLDHVLSRGEPGPFQVQAAIAALHAEAPSWEATDWSQIAALYGELHRLAPSPVVIVNRAAALALADGPHVGLALLATLEGDGWLDRYQPLHATRAELHARAGDLDRATDAYRRAIALTQNQPERRALVARATRFGCAI